MWVRKHPAKFLQNSCQISRKFPSPKTKKNLVDVSDIFYFFCSGRGKGESEAPGGGGGIGFLLKIPRGGGISRRGRGREGVCGELGYFGGGGGLNIFFRARNVHQENHRRASARAQGECIAVLLGKPWWLWSPGCSLVFRQTRFSFAGSPPRDLGPDRNPWH